MVWLKNGVEIRSTEEAKITQEVKELEYGLKEVTYSLKFPAGRHEDTGLYMIKCKNKYGYAEASARLDIVLKPEIEGLKDQSSEPGHQVIFEAKVYANPQPKVTWTRGSENCANLDNCEIIVDVENETYTLVISNIAVSDKGAYTLTASNANGETSKNVNLHLHVEKPEFIKMPEDQTVHDYDGVDERVRVKGIPRPTLKWFKNGEEIDENEVDEETGKNKIRTEITGETQILGDLHMSHFRNKDAGMYSAVASNVCGDTEAKFKLNILQKPPAFEQKLPKSLEVDEGEKLELKCKINGSPIPDVQWFKDSVPIKPDNR